MLLQQMMRMFMKHLRMCSVHLQIPASRVKSLISPTTKMHRISPRRFIKLTQSTDFWILAHALGKFIAKAGVLPLAGVVPDMKSDTESFIQLQMMYLLLTPDTAKRPSKTRLRSLHSST
jgi:hypothetical protein